MPSLLSVFYRAARPGYRDNALLKHDERGYSLLRHKVQEAADYLRSFSESLE
jgi:hypothetical protein